MGWGTKVAGAKPQPKESTLPTLDDGPEISEDAATALRKKHAPKDESKTEWFGDEPKEKPTDAAKAEMAWSQFRSRKGWVPETVAMLLYEFVRDHGLFEELIAFAKKRK